MRIFLPFVLILLSGCFKDETISGFTDTTTVWQLVEIDGNRTEGPVTLEFPEEGRIAGKGPCNRYFASQTAPYPWFEVSAIGSTKMACPNLRAEAAFFSTLQAMTLIEVSGDTLLLSNDSGGSMVFEAQEGV
ncbi:META domain-containing protein [Algirhabdus cladophorae]|uniref:META domain-containing protein n=1 Tax=Algirhabdus cladophorae TaxID=3377108 RepID=UPI003B84662C